MKKALDALKQEIHINDYIVYATRRGSSLNMNLAQVIEINCKGKNFISLRVQVVLGNGPEFTLGNWDRKKNDFIPVKTRKTTLTQTNNCVVVNGISAKLIKK